MAGIGRAKGSPKVEGSGRVRGRPKASKSHVQIAMEQLKFDPIAELIKLHGKLAAYGDVLDDKTDMYHQGKDLLANRLESICKTLLPYIVSRKAQEVVQHNINTTMPDIDKAREAIMRTMTRLRTDTPE